MPMATKLNRVVTCKEELILMKSHDLSVTCFVRSRGEINI